MYLTEGKWIQGVVKDISLAIIMATITASDTYQLVCVTAFHSTVIESSELTRC